MYLLKRGNEIIWQRLFRNKELMLTSGTIPLVEKMISRSNSRGPAPTLYLNLSCLEEAMPMMAQVKEFPFSSVFFFRAKKNLKTNASWTPFTHSTTFAPILPIIPLYYYLA